MSKSLVPAPQGLATPTAADLHASRARLLHSLARMRGLQYKLVVFFSGFEVQALADDYGVSQGKTGSQAQPWAEYIEARTGIPYRTAQRYRLHFQSLSQSHPEAAKKLVAHWAKQSAAAITDEAQAEALTTVDLSTKVLEEICAHEDQWGLHDIFTTPTEERDVGGDAGDEDEKKAKKNPLSEFYLRTVASRLSTDDFLRLPKRQLQTLATTLEQAAKKAKEALHAKGGSK